MADRWLWAIGAIILIAIVAEFSPRVGWGLAILAAMGMIASYYRKAR